MTTIEAFFEPGSRVLTRGAFEFALNLDLKRATRSQDFLTLLMIETVREWEHMTFTADESMLREVAQSIGQSLRSTDLLGRTDEGMLAILLLDCGFEQCSRPVDRIVSRIENYRFSQSLRIIVGASGFPTHAMDAASLKRQAIGRPIVNVRTGLGPDGSPAFNTDH